MGRFEPNRAFRRHYKAIFRRDPLAANVYLLLCEIANDNGQVETDPMEIAALMAARFNDPEACQL